MKVVNLWLDVERKKEEIYRREQKFEKELGLV